MKAEFKAKIIGHELFTPDKEEPNREAVRVKLQIANSNPIHLGKPSKGVLTIEEKDLPKFPLRGYLTITVQDSQQVLDFSPPRAGKTDDAQVSMPGTEGGGRRRGSKTTH